MSSFPRFLGHMREKLAGLDDYLALAECLHQQKHLDRKTTESAYWHSGYRQAIHDFLGVLDEVSRSSTVPAETPDVRLISALTAPAMRT